MQDFPGFDRDFPAHSRISCSGIEIPVSRWVKKPGRMVFAGKYKPEAGK